MSGAGLSEAEAAARLAQHGPNRMSKAAPPSHLALLAAALMQARHLLSSGVYPLCVSLEAMQSFTGRIKLNAPRYDSCAAAGCPEPQLNPRAALYSHVPRSVCAAVL